jgi:hypothetical protein
MPINRSTIEDARSAKAEARQRLSGVPGVVGVGLTRQGEGYAVKVNLQDDQRDLVPDELSGVPVVVEVVGKIRKRD